MTKRKIIASTLLILGIGIALIYFGNRQMPVSGKIITWSDETAVENITINGSAQSIPFHDMPKNAQDNPENNIRYLNLISIKAIIPWISSGRPNKLYSFNGHEYVEVRVLWKDNGAKFQHFLIDRNAKIFFDEQIGPKHHREISFLEFFELMID